MLAILEIPLLGYTFAPEATPRAAHRFRDALNRHGGRILYIGALVVGLVLVARGLFELVA